MDIIILGTVLGFLAALVNTAVMIGSILNLRQKEEKPLQETTQPTEKKLVEQIRESVNALEFLSEREKELEMKQLLEKLNSDVKKFTEMKEQIINH